MKTKHQVLIHVVVWLLFLGLPVTRTLMVENETPGIGIQLFVFGLINVLNFYLCYFLINKYVLKNSNALKNIWLLLPVVLVFASLSLFTERLLDHYYPDKELEKMTWAFNAIRHFINTLVYSVVSLFITFIVGWIKTQKQKDELVKQNQQSELALLRSQINPHFLFNTLNNLYSLVYRKSDEAPDALMKLSDILRYMLYDSNAERVELKQEITYIRSYIELQQLRLTTPDFVRFNVNCDMKDQMIPPMLLISFIENAFKHGSKNTSSPGIIITLDCREEMFTFGISNTIVPGQMQNKDMNPGIGLTNIKRRLELIYPGRHELEVQTTDDKFSVKLRIKEL